MSTDIYVVSGFLGAGKTTLIQKLLKESFQNHKVVLIENDFGDISVDAALLKTNGVEVKEINSGCICCSLQGNFTESIVEMTDRFHPDQIIIEPSGVAKLSDVIKVFTNQRIPQNINLKAKITVVDATCCQEYLENFGEFFADQIENADIILLSRTEMLTNDQIDDACKLIQDLNTKAFVFSRPWNQINSDAILCCGNEGQEQEDQGGRHACYLPELPVYDRGGFHDSNNHCGHDHAAADIFDTVTIYTQKVFTMEDLQARIREMEEIYQGKVLRVKGIIHGVNGYLNLQYVPSDVQITGTISSGGFINIIGSNLNRQELSLLFTEEVI